MLFIGKKHYSNAAKSDMIIVDGYVSPLPLANQSAVMKRVTVLIYREKNKTSYRDKTPTVSAKSLGE